jgi:hypothetical protein
MQVDLSKLIMPQGLKLSTNVSRDLDLEYFNHIKHERSSTHYLS